MIMISIGNAQFECSQPFIEIMSYEDSHRNACIWLNFTLNRCSLLLNTKRNALNAACLAWLAGCNYTDSFKQVSSRSPQAFHLLPLAIPSFSEWMRIRLPLCCSLSFAIDVVSALSAAVA